MERLCLAAAVCAGALVALAGPAQAATYPESAGPPARVNVAHLDFDQFFNPVITIHVGDTVRWAVNGFHTITFPARGQAAPPFIVPGAGLVSGVNDAAGNPLWFNGKVPNLIINPAAAFPSGGSVVTGTAVVNSGLPANPGAARPVSFKFTKTGTFKYQCLPHPSMTGVVKVVPKSRHVPTAKQDARSARLGLAALVRRAKALAKVKPGPLRVFAGSDKAGVAWLRFFPATLRVKVGQAVQFVMRAPNEIHTISFGPAAYTKALENSFTTVVPNPMGPPTIKLNALAAYASDPGALPPYTGANHGNGFENSGILTGSPSRPLASSTTFVFGKAGTYHYECVVHRNMDGTVIVTP